VSLVTRTTSELKVNEKYNLNRKVTNKELKNSQILHHTVEKLTLSGQSRNNGRNKF